MRGRWLLLLLSMCLPPAVSAADNAYLQELVAQARAKHLAQRPEWLNLLHFKPYVYRPGWRSLADDPDFFNAPNGKHDAQAELEATLASFFSNIQETDKVQNPQCRFIARYHWLKGELHFDPARLPEQPCKRFYQWRASLDPHEITLVFPAAYLNNPASMYGHTLLRVDGKDQNEHTRLLAYSISYAAGTNETSGLVFAVKGLFGGYPGIFSITPYYIKVREYSDIENRDVWEYRLTLTPVEIDRLLMHTWELGPTRFDYYFFDENCAYHLLSLLEVARPGLELTDQFRWWAIPSDTVRAVAETPGLVKQVIYRPATATVIRWRLRALDPAERRVAKDLAEQKITPSDERVRALPTVDQARVLELGYDYADYEKATGRGQAADPEHMRDLLLARSRLDVPSQRPDVPEPAVRPDQGHKTSRMALGVGRHDGRTYEEFRLRPTYHDLMDDDGGYTRGAQIEFFDMAFRHYRGEDGLRLEHFTPLDIVSLTPRDEFFHPVSWKINIGWTRQHFAANDEPLVFRMNGGPGLAYNMPGSHDGHSIYYGYFEASLDVGQRYDHAYALGAGPSIGWITDLSDRWRVNLYARALRYGIGGAHDSRALVLEQRYSLTRQSALRLELSRKQEFHDYWNGAELSLNLYF
ncbi:MAG: Lnb N-terminal periplasmic domain-containing protein [Sulfuricaulis sp.]